MADNNSYIRVEKVVSNILANTQINLSTLFGGSLPTIILNTIRGYPYNLDIANGTGSSSNSGNFVPVILSNVLNTK